MGCWTLEGGGEFCFLVSAAGLGLVEESGVTGDWLWVGFVSGFKVVAYDAEIDCFEFCLNAGDYRF